MTTELIRSNVVLTPHLSTQVSPVSVWQTWLRLALFLTPILALTALPVAVVDPFNVLRSTTSVIPAETKARYGEGVNDVLWKLPEYIRNPRENILLGDSQMERLSAREILTVTGNSNYSNLAYGGGTLRESISSFWLAASLTKLQSVYYEISFMDYNPNPMDRVAETQRLLHNRLQYFEDADALQASYYDVLAYVPGLAIKMGPKTDRVAFWNYQLRYLANRYHDIAYPAEQKQELQRIAEYCRAHHVKLVFVITPQSLDAQRRIVELGVTDQYFRFKADLASIAPTLDYDIPSAITRDRDNYSDPFHLQDDAAARVVQDIWSGKFAYCHVLGEL